MLFVIFVFLVVYILKLLDIFLEHLIKPGDQTFLNPGQVKANLNCSVGFLEPIVRQGKCFLGPNMSKQKVHTSVRTDMENVANLVKCHTDTDFPKEQIVAVI